MSNYVYTLEEAPEDAASVGGKAAGLGRLLRGGLPTPPGFVLTADAFRAYVNDNGIADKLTAAESQSDAASCLRAGEWPAQLREQVESSYAALRERSGGVPVAVRSSATAEDSAGASFAGQHATLLNLDGIDAVLDGILSCWASLYSAEATHYRKARGVVDDGPAMAVVVQALVPAEASGVAFTLDPVGGDRDVVLIDAAFGLGEGVVSGIVSPDHFVVSKADGAIVKRELAEKTVRILPAAEGGTRSEELSAAQAREPAISDERAAELARMATKIEEQAGVPQDIEWAVAGGTIYVLQARPVTAFAAPASPAVPEPPPAEGWVSEFDTDTSPDTIWTAANVQEVLPDQLSPFGCSITADLIERWGIEPMEKLGLRLEGETLFSAYFYGRAFLNVSMMLEVIDQTPFASTEGLMEQFYGTSRGADVLDDIGLKIPAKRFSFGRLLGYMRILPRAIWFSLRMPAEIRRAEGILAELEKQDAARPVETQSDEELVRTMEDGLGPSGEIGMVHVSGAGITGAAFERLRSATKAWLGDENGTLQATLCSGLASLESAQPAYDLWDLSRLVLASDALRKAFEPRDANEIERRLNAQQNEAVAGFRRRLDQFLARHGHRSVMEAELAAKSWREDLPRVYAMVRNYLRADPERAPRRSEERQRRAREKVTKESLARLSWWKRPVFRYVLNQAHAWVASREHTKSMLVLGSNRGRVLTRELARRMVTRGLLKDPADFYYLTWDEARALLEDGLSKDQAWAAIERRRAEEEHNRSVVLPEIFKGRPKPLRPEDRPLPEGRVLRGIPVSPGRVTGPARVILDPRRDAAIEPGEILVAPVTDAGWTPLFVTAAGVVVDVGGSLSHGSTVAREYGLPAVVNVKHGTRMIRTGQTVTVDGAEGVVVLEED